MPGGIAWARVHGGPGPTLPAALLGERGGGSWAVGSFEGQATFEQTTLRSAGGTDLFIARFDPAGSVLFSAGLGGAGDERGEGLAPDHAGGVYLLGTFRNGQVPLPGGGLLGARGRGDAFLLDLAVDGTIQGALQLARSDDAEVAAEGITSTPSGPVVIGRFSGTLGTAEVSFENAGAGPAMFVLGLGADLSYRWHATASGCAYSAAERVGADLDGNVYVLGRARGRGCDLGTGPQFFSESESDSFLAKYPAAASGSTRPLWLASFGRVEEGTPQAVAVNPLGQALSLCPGRYPALDGGFEIIQQLRGVSPDGAHQRQATMGSASLGRAVLLDAAANVWVTGGSPEGVLLMKRDPSSAIAWVRSLPAAGSGRALALDGDGNVTVAGDLSGGMMIGRALLEAPRGRGFFLLRLHK